MLTTQKTKLDFILYPTLKEAFTFRLLVQKCTKGFLQNQELSKFLSLRDDLQSNVNLVIAMITLKSEGSPTSAHGMIFAAIT